ncbi:hypothetical protein E3T28_04865 [Cryobacterium sinapicolor]|uniref:Uncharacterized protein n=1 Tax=Cryobacterium sinapicolor TaxID=1259236 RepID=A0ABY2JCN5_9MICO|nr:hypothetical protein [Cryobacterium sinapicolor]TFD02723.1 hypothetical protein E3T28_04865 [Cryobacterium sinapicolor]
MRMVTASGRSRWPIIIGATALVVAIGGGIAYTANRPAPTPGAAPSTATATPTPTPTGSTGAAGAGDDVAPTGCLGGQDRNVNMVLAAQADAKHTTYGAVETATAFYRFIWQYPYPSAEDANTITNEVMTANTPASYADLAGTYASTEDLTTGDLEPGTPFHLSTTNGLWLVAQDSTADRVTVNIAAGYVVNGELSPTKVTAQAFVMVWEGDAWHVEKGEQPDAEKLGAGGNRYTRGC